VTGEGGSNAAFPLPRASDRDFPREPNSSGHEKEPDIPSFLQKAEEF
jgi:hypothetical protein